MEEEMFEELKNGINTQIRLEKKDQIDKLAVKISNAMSEAAARGGLYDGHTDFQISELCCLAVGSRGQFIWNTIWRFITTAGVSYSADVQKELTSLFKEYFTDVDDIKGQMPSIKSFGMPHRQIEPRLMEYVNEKHTDTMDRISSEIELFVISLKKKETKEEKLPTIINFYSPVGAVQTGPSATASITQNIGTEAKDAIKAAFEMLLMKLPEVQEFQQKSELSELAEDGKIELSKQKPNSLKIQNYILTIGTMIQTTAALQPAYQLLKQGAAYLGVNLP
jgi:hypothetical protein